MNGIGLPAGLVYDGPWRLLLTEAEDATANATKTLDEYGPNADPANDGGGRQPSRTSIGSHSQAGHKVGKNDGTCCRSVPW